MNSKSVRRVTPEQRKILQAKAAQRSKSRQEQQQQQQLAAGAVSKAAAAMREGQAREDAGVESFDSSSVELGEDATSAMAFQSLNQSLGNEPGTSVFSSSMSRSQQRYITYRSGEANNSCLEIPLEDFSHKNQLKHSSLERARPSGLTQRDIFKFQRSLSHSPSRSNGRPQEASTSLILANRTEVARRLSAPIMISSSKKTTVTKVSTATQVGRPHGQSNPSDPQLAKVLPLSGQNSNLPVRRRFLSGPSPATLRAADAPSLSLLSQQIDPGAVVPVPKLLPPADAAPGLQSKDQVSNGSSVTDQNLGARPKLYASASAELRPEFKVPPVPASGSAAGLTAQKLSLHGLHHASDQKKVSLGRDDTKAMANSAVSPETPSSDSAVSSDASMISISSKASESSMDVDSDNNANAGGPIVGRGVVAAEAAADVVKPATASQQLTQLAQMVQEHYPYKASDMKHHTG